MNLLTDYISQLTQVVDDRPTDAYVAPICFDSYRQNMINTLRSFFRRDERVKCSISYIAVSETIQTHIVIQHNQVNIVRDNLPGLNKQHRIHKIMKHNNIPI